jgi:hypothetical protein
MIPLPARRRVLAYRSGHRFGAPTPNRIVLKKAPFLKENAVARRRKFQK